MDTLQSDPAPVPKRAPLTLWLTDRSRYEEGTSHCQRARYLKYHAGPHGYGWDKKAQSIPTVTGTLVHGPITAILGHLRDHDAIPTPAWIAEHAINPAVREYHRIANTRGLGAVVDPETLALQIMEQVTLLEGLVWTWVRGPLPAYHAANKVLLVEKEFANIVGCTCGLTDAVGTAWDHDARGCDGIGWMTRGDCVAENRTTGTGRYDEFKTTSGASMNWEAA